MTLIINQLNTEMMRRDLWGGIFLDVLFTFSHQFVLLSKASAFSLLDWIATLWYGTVHLQLLYCTLLLHHVVRFPSFSLLAVCREEHSPFQQNTNTKTITNTGNCCVLTQKNNTTIRVPLSSIQKK